MSIAIVVCASLMYFIERGRFNERMSYWERPYNYLCDVAIAADPGGPALEADVSYSAVWGLYKLDAVYSLRVVSGVLMMIMTPFVTLRK